jgi:hypothetical protein
VAGRRFGDGAGGRNAAVPAGDVFTPGCVERALGIVDLGALVSLSRSRDGGALSITITFDGEYEREWFRSEADAILQLDEWAGMIEDAAREAPPAARAQRRTRSR